MHAEKAHEEKEYQSCSTQAHVRESEEALEENLDSLDKDNSSVLSGDKTWRNFMRKMKML